MPRPVVGYSISISTAPSSRRQQQQRHLSSATSFHKPLIRNARDRTHLIFGANTDVGKTLVSAGLVRASLLSPSNHDEKRAVAVQYIKPLQCGGSDQAFVKQYLTCHNSNNNNNHHHYDNDSSSPLLETKTLFAWDTFASPHTASRLENKPVGEEQILTALQQTLQDFWSRHDHHHDNNNNKKKKRPTTTTTSFIETAGGVLSPSSASPPPPLHGRTTSSPNDNNDNNNNNHINNNDPSNWTWTTQGDLYQPLAAFAPVILVGDGRLGGISATLSALESLLLRGYDIAAICLVQTNNNNHHGHHENASAIREYLVTSRQERQRRQQLLSLQTGTGERLMEGIFLSQRQAIVELPPIPADPTVPLHDWYEQTTEQFVQLNDYLHNTWQGQVADLKSLAEQGRDVLWVEGKQQSQQGVIDSPLVLESASDQHVHIVQSMPTPSRLESRCLLDASGLLRRGDSAMALATAAAIGRYGPVNGTTFPQSIIHAPAVTLSQKLLAAQQSWANRVWLANDASRATEASIRMAIKTYQTRQGVAATDIRNYDWAVCGQEDCYHGDTLGARNVAESYADDDPSMQHPWYMSKGLCLETPTISYHKGVLSIAFPESFQPPQDGKGPTTYEFENMAQAMNVVARRINPRLFSLYKEVIEMQWLVYEHSGLERKIAAVILEPLLLLGRGGGMLKLVDPLWQRALVDIAKSRNVPVIYDETVSGMYRLGKPSCREYLQADPDIATYGNLLTGGLLPLSATLTSKEVYEACCGTEEPFLLNDAFAAHPAGCVVGIQAMDAYKAVFDTETSNPDSIRMLFDEQMVKDLSKLVLVDESFALGTVLAVRILSPNNDGSEQSTPRMVQSIVSRLQQQHSILVQTQRNAIYVMVSPLSTPDDCIRISDCLYETVEAVGKES